MNARDPVVQTALEQIVPLRADEPYDWPAVLRRIDGLATPLSEVTSTRAAGRVPGMRKRLPFQSRPRVAVAAITAAVVLAVPVLAFGATQGWWFDRADGHRRGGVVEITHGMWSGWAWTMTAYLNADDEVCFAITPDGQENVDGEGAGMACVPLAAFNDAPSAPRLSYLGGFSQNFPDFVAGVVVPTAEDVRVSLSTGSSLTLPVVPAPEELGAMIAFFATELPCQAHVSRITATDSSAATVAEVELHQWRNFRRGPC